MTNEEKALLIKDLSTRLPYGIKVMKQFKTQTRTLVSIDVVKFRVYFLENDVNSPFGFDIESPLNLSQQIKPYLRSMETMTEEEKKEFINCSGYEVEESVNGRHYEYCLKDYVGTPEKPICNWDAIDWLNAHHFDYLGLIERDLALQAPEGMYKI